MHQVDVREQASEPLSPIDQRLNLIVVKPVKRIWEAQALAQLYNMDRAHPTEQTHESPPPSELRAPPSELLPPKGGPNKKLGGCASRRASPAELLPPSSSLRVGIPLLSG